MIYIWSWKGKLWHAVRYTVPCFRTSLVQQIIHLLQVIWIVWSFVLCSEEPRSDEENNDDQEHRAPDENHDSGALHIEANLILQKIFIHLRHKACYVYWWSGDEAWPGEFLSGAVHVWLARVPGPDYCSPVYTEARHWTGPPGSNLPTPPPPLTDFIQFLLISWDTKKFYL